MTLTGGIVIYAVLWFMGLLIALPLGLRTYGDKGEAPGADDPHAGAWSPVNANVKAKMIRVTWISALLWIPIFIVITSGIITVQDLDFFGRMDR